MTLKAACEIGKACDLHSVEEAVTNAFIHAQNLFPEKTIDEELVELSKEWNYLEGVDPFMSIDEFESRYTKISL